MNHKIIILTASLAAILTASCKTAGPEVIKNFPNYSQEIDLNKIGMQPLGAGESDTSVIQIRENSKGRPVALLELDYKNSGINVVEEITRGKILEHHIVILDSRGKEIGRAPINFIAFEVEQIASTVESQKLLFTDSGSEVEYEKSPKPRSQPLERKARLKVYSDSENVPQYVELNQAPASGSNVSIYLELVYIQPFYSELCKAGDSSCPQIEKAAFKQVQEDNRKTLAKIEQQVNETLQKSQEGKEAEVVALESDALVFRLQKPVEDYKQGIKRSIDSANRKARENAKEDPYVNHTAKGGDYLHYREWRLLTVPRYFSIRDERNVPLQSSTTDVD